MKNIKFYILMICLAISLAGCGLNLRTNNEKRKDSLNEKTLEKLDSNAVTAVEEVDVVEANNKKFADHASESIEDKIVNMGPYHKDKKNKNVLYNSHIIDGADYDSFEVLALENEISDHSINSDYAKDKNSVYSRDRKIDISGYNIDLETFHYVGCAYFADKNKVYITSFKILKDANPKTFEAFNPFNENYPGVCFGKDDEHVYKYEFLIENADPKTFKALEFDYYRDKNNIYLGTTRIIGADPDTFHVLEGNNGYEADKDNVFFITQKLEGSDPSTFEVLNYDYAKDKNQVYYKARKTSCNDDSYSVTGVIDYTRQPCKEIIVVKSADPFSFEILSNWYSKDKNNLFYKASVVPGADPESFGCINEAFIEPTCSDKNFYYCNGIVSTDKYCEVQ